MRNIFFISLFAAMLSGCYGKKNAPDDFLTISIQNAEKHYTLQTSLIEESGKALLPRTFNHNQIVYVSSQNWTSGFFPGSLWNLYRLTKNEKWMQLAEKYTGVLENIRYLTTTHDIGFMIGCSYLNGYRIRPNEAYRKVIIEAARSLSTRFRPNAGIIQSWDTDKGWIATRGWMCPVIIDNMMNLELLFEASALSGDSTFYRIAVSHADKTMENHFRSNYSSYHVVDYHPETGEVRSRETAQGYSHESAWARGQAWAIYGFTICYRHTRDVKYLELAKNIYNFIFTNENLPVDLIPYWDYDVLNKPNEPRDASAAAITASALYEIASYVPENRKYRETADKILETLASPAYAARPGTNGNFILMHCVGSIPHKEEIDAPLNYADYYFLEAIIRSRKTNE
jgi:rhamnogalacturonyl hydrolase YesR